MREASTLRVPLGDSRGTGDVGRLEEAAEVVLYFTVLRYSKRSLTAICHPDTAGSASALSPLRKITGYAGSLAL
jgi:hypothetical protein